MTKTSTEPLIYSCSGCSDVAQLANHVAVRMDRLGHAEMSCIAGVGGGVKSLVRKAQSKRDIIAIDGCALACAKACLQGVGVTPAHYFLLSDWQYKKAYHQDYSAEDVRDVCDRILRTLAH